MAQSTLRRLEQAPPGLGGEPAIARIRIAMGNIDGGVAALQRAVTLHDPFFNSEPLTSPPFGRLKNDPRLAALSRQLLLMAGS